MLATSLDREDIKAVLRKRHGSVRAFAEARDLKAQAIADFLRGRTSARVAEEIEAELKRHQEATESIKLDDSDDALASHRLNAGAR